MTQATPTRTTPITQPATEPIRRMEPEKVCPAQRVRIGETVRRLLP
jgi:hypothetical protein